MLTEILHAARALLRRPGFTIVVVLTLALGIGANTAIFSIVDSVLLRPLPYPNASRLAAVWGVYPEFGNTSTSLPDFRDYRAQTRRFDALGAASMQGLNLAGDGSAERVSALNQTANYLSVLGLSPTLGRGFLPEEESRTSRVLMLGHDFWQRRYAGDRSVLGRTLSLNGRPYTVVGVGPKGLAYPENADLLLPLNVADTNASRRAEFLTVVGRLAPGATLREAKAEMMTIAQRLAQEYPETNATIRTTVVDLQEEIVGNVRPALLVFMGAVGIVLLVVCVNVANLLLARAVGREREMSIRSALGATRARIFRQLVLESLVLALAGGALGVALAWVVVGGLRGIEFDAVPRLAEVSLDARVGLFALALSLLTGVLFGIVPALRLAETSLQGTLRSGGRGMSGTAGVQRLRGGLVLAEVALAVMLLVGAGLLLRSFVELQRTHPGFDPAPVMTARVALPAVRYDSAAKVRAFWTALETRLQAIPGVSAAALTSALPFAGVPYLSFEIPGQPERAPGGPPQDVQPYNVTPGYFQTMGITLKRGRGLSDADAGDAPAVAIVNETFAKRYFPGEDPIGKRIVMWDTATIVGIAGDVRQESLGDQPYPQLYWSALQQTPSGMFVALRTSGGGDPTQVTAAVRRIVAELDPELPLHAVASMDERIALTVAQPKLAATLTSAFAIATLVLAAIGVYGVVSYGVAQRTRELGVRMALGANAGDVRMLVLRQAMSPVAIGIVVGLVGAWAGGRLLRQLLYGVGSTDVATFVGTALFLGIVAAVSAWLPARRATAITPTEALRYE